jgi:hypothetical protein
MAETKKSYDMPIDLPDGISRQQMMELVDEAARGVGLYISHIGSYSRKKYPNSVHWHFKRDKKEVGLIDATFWDVKSLFWLMIRNSEPDWVHAMAPRLQEALQREIRKLQTV